MIWVGLVVWTITVLFLTFATDLIVPESKNLSDFHLNFWEAGYLVAHNQIHDLYPRLTALGPVGERFDEIAHQLFPNIPSTRHAIFLYVPLMAVLCAPFGFLSGVHALIVWQALNVSGLVAYSLYIAREQAVKWWQAFVLGFVYLPVASTIWIGQCSMLVGLFPLVLGYIAAKKNKDFLAGLIWSLMFLKPQYSPIPLFTAITSGRWMILAGFMTGCAAILGVSFVCFSPEIFWQWFHAASQLGEKAISGAFAVPPTLVTTVPGCILVNLPPEVRTSAKWIVYLVCGGIALPALFLVLFRARKKTSASTFLDFALLLNILFLPTYSRLLNYDLTLGLVAFQLACLNLRTLDNKTARGLVLLSLTSVLLVNLQVLGAVFFPNILFGIIIAIGLAAIPAWACVIIERSDSD